MEVTWHFIHAYALVDVSDLFTTSKCLFASSTCSLAWYILKSILSRIVPYSTTNTDISLKIAARSLIDLTKVLISSSLYFGPRF